MAKSRREFLADASAGLFGAAAAITHAQNQNPTKSATPKSTTSSQSEQPGTPSAFGTAPAVGPEVSSETFAEAEKLVRIELTEAERAQAAGNWRNAMAALYERRTGPRKSRAGINTLPCFALGSRAPGNASGSRTKPIHSQQQRSRPVAHARRRHRLRAVTQLSRWIESRKLTSERLTTIYLERIERFNPQLRCVITVTREPALTQAKQGRRSKSPPANIAVRCTASPGAARICSTPPVSPPPTAPSLSGIASRRRNAAVVQRLDEAGAVLIAKLSLGALALNDVWFGGQTMNPWLLEEGASGSSAGPGAATAAGLVGFLGRQRDRSAASSAPACAAVLPDCGPHTAASPAPAR